MASPIPPVTAASSPSPFISPEPVAFPLAWILRHASAPIQYRAITEVAKLEVDRSRLASLTLSFKPALQLALAQSPSGVWNDAMLSIPAADHTDPFRGVGTIPAYRRLLEYGWDRESPPFVHARRILFRLLAEDDDPSLLFELARNAGDDADLIHHWRTVLREAAAAALAQAGFEGDPRLRGAAMRILDRVDAFLRSPLSRKPWVRVGNRQVLSPDAAPPSIHVLTMVAHMPLFRIEHHAQVDHLYTWVSQTLPRQEAQQLIGRQVVPQPHLILGDPLAHRGVADADVPFAIVWLELMARLQFLRRNETWLGLFERFLDDRDREHVWHPHRGTAVPRSDHPAVWPAFPLEPGAAAEDRWTDVTFRLGLIARLLGRPIEVV